MLVRDFNGIVGSSLSIVAKFVGKKLFYFWQSYCFKLGFLDIILDSVVIFLSDPWLFSSSPANLDRHYSTTSLPTDVELLLWREDPCLLFVKLIIERFLVVAKELYFCCLSWSLSDYISNLSFFFYFSWLLRIVLISLSTFFMKIATFFLHSWYSYL